MIPEPFFDSTTKNYCLEYGVRTVGHIRPPRGGERRLGAFNLPPFQRGVVWSEQQMIRFIESIWLKLPLGSYVVNRDDNDEDGYPCDQWLLDGQQRWTAIMTYLDDALVVFDLAFSELTVGQQRKFLNHPFSAIETRGLTPDRCRDVYERLAYGGTPHDDRDL